LVFVIMLAYVLSNPAFRQYALFKQSKLDLAIIKSIFTLGGPISAQFAIELCAYALAAMLMGLLSVDALAAQQMVIQSGILAGIIPFSMSQGASILISKKMGQNDLEGVREIVKHGMTLVVLIATVIAVFYLTCSDWIISLYIDNRTLASDANVISTAKVLLSMFAVTQLLDCVRNMLGSSLTGLRRSHLAMLASFVSCWVIAVPVSYLAMFYFHLGPIGMPVGFQLGFAAGIVMTMVLLKRLTGSPDSDVPAKLVTETA
ncbi:MAG: MATE family efflux transporter, partial [Prosthecobacter sp.]|nr:MATE family efflux transporter [Prosthecobacter sp.]